jgi:CRISPR-associated protein Csh1
MLLGKTVAERDGYSDVLECLMDDMDYKYGLALRFQRKEGKISFIGVELNELGSLRLPKVYYLKAPSPRSPDISPVTKLSGEDKTEKRVKDLYGSLKKMAEWAEERAKREFSCLCNQISFILKEKEKDITKALESELRKEKRRKRDGSLKVIIHPTFFYIEVDDQPLSLFDECKEYLREMAVDEYGRIPKTKIPCYLEDGICSVCQRRSERLYGNYSEIKCYSLDKPGSIAGGAHTASASKNHPVCSDCAGFIKNGWKYTNQKLIQTIGKRPYLLLPRMELDFLRRRWLNLIEGFQRDVLEKSELKDTVEKEKYLLKKIAQEFSNEVLASYCMVFYKSAKQEWKIEAEIEEVLPSRVAEILKVMENVEEKTPFRGENRVNYSLIRSFASGRRKDAFIEVLEAVFSGRRKISYEVALSWVVEQIIDEYKGLMKENRWRTSLVVKGYLFLKFLLDLKVLEKEEVKGMPEEEKRSKYGLFLEEYRGFFDKPEKRVAFLTGALVDTVLYVQKEELGSPAFFKKLHGLRLNQEYLKRIKTETEFKLHQYRDAVQRLKAEYNLKLLLSELSLIWCKTEGRWDISEDEATFFFTLGLNLNYYITQEMGKKEVLKDGRE